MNLRVTIWALAFSVGMAHTLLAQEPSVPDGLSVAEQKAVNKQDPNDRAKEYMKIATQRAKDARKSADQGDAQALEQAMRGHQAAMKGAMQTIEEGQSRGEDMTTAWEAVNRGTSKHTEVLRDVLTRVPENARPGIERAIAASQRGHETALQSIERARQQRMARDNSEFPHRDGMSDRGIGRPGAVGAGRSAGGPSSGAGPGRGRGGKP